jgi:sugar phosphate isomerase/epimerase
VAGRRRRSSTTRSCPAWKWPKSCEVFLLIEPEPGLLIERFEQYLEFAGRIDSPWIGLNFDIGHAYCVGEDPQDWIARMAPHTKHYHVEDIPAVARAPPPDSRPGGD